MKTNCNFTKLMRGQWIGKYYFYAAALYATFKHEPNMVASEFCWSDKITREQARELINV